MGFWDWVSSWFAEKKQPLTAEVPLNEERRHIRNYILRVNGKKVETQGDFEGNLGIYNLTVTPMYGSHNARLILQMKFSRKIVKELKSGINLTTSLLSLMSKIFLGFLQLMNNEPYHKNGKQLPPPRERRNERAMIRQL